ncbi:tRNA(Ile)-lysidine synthase TilS/MesJ [Geosmithia morbida]|uniref:tRNA(Ile)-lysidine synthetase n=1 Tax=Geosmithia morbida TaxID=1094350 RepID=A0A9P4YU07_9HYPO|nr:tRNA(Ile)-lysidine synthase TilS/MesJ [Geosmithia morbida]KAF4121646.1 tRNA(Ile)-lysidine synthase TilS/MesJ [Geosmithia morbida]
MGSRSPTRFLNSVTRPVAVLDFKESLDAICRPQFPAASWAQRRVPVLAISGGVDSMALAFLFSELQKTFPGLQLGSYPTHPACAVTVDHSLRPESADEAREVARTVRGMGSIKSMVRAIRWRDLRRRGIDPATLPNIESLSRRLRYRWLGLTCRALKSPFLFTAHHEDDQYETLLMRLLAGHGYRGLQGIRSANDMPETDGIYGVHKSGLLVDQKSPQPLVNFRPTVRETKKLRHIFTDDKDAGGGDVMLDWDSLDGIHFHPQTPPANEPLLPYLTPLSTEDGGVQVYRPLLGFGKDRLRATCEANGIPWFEDSTNQDETMTRRNAVRHLVGNYTLPRALQKPAVLAMCHRSQRRRRLEEAEARRLLVRAAVARDFDSCAGTLIIDPPTLGARDIGSGRPRRLHDDARREARRPHQRLIAALATRHLMSFVTPEKSLPAPSTVGTVVDRLFPDLAPEPPTGAPAAFSFSGVLFDPIVRPGTPTKWLLSRAPYRSSLPAPDFSVDWRDCSTPPPTDEESTSGLLDTWAEKSHGWRRLVHPKMWDGRYWISLASCVSERFHVRPYRADRAREFRASLPPKTRARLEDLLKHYAPGKVRTTLPALYRADTGSGDERERVRDEHLEMLALPSLGIRLDGLDRWVKYEISYKKVDATLLGGGRGTSSRGPLVGYRGTVGLSRRRRLQRMRHP